MFINCSSLFIPQQCKALMACRTHTSSVAVTAYNAVLVRTAMQAARVLVPPFREKYHIIDVVAARGRDDENEMIHLHNYQAC